MEVDIMNQEESKLKPPSSELDSPLESTTATGRDQSSNSGLRLRQRRSNNPRSSQHPSQHITSHHSFPPAVQDTHVQMDPSPAQAPQLRDYFVQRKPGDISYSHSAEVLPHHYTVPAYSSQEDDTALRDGEPDVDEMEIDPFGTTTPDKSLPLNAGDTKVGGQKNFVYKLWQMLNDGTTRSQIDWTPDGSEFTIYNQEEFARDVLLAYFKHSNFSSFVRQLNMYDFHKTNRAPRSARGAPQLHHWTFSHKYFRRGRPDQLPLIKRKAADGPTSTTQYSEDSYAPQAQMDRRTSVSVGIRSPPNGLAVDQDAIITELRNQNADLHRRLSLMERGYMELTAKLDRVIQRLPEAPARASHRATPTRTSATSQVQHAPQSTPAQYPHNVPSSLGIPDYSQTSRAPSAHPTDSQLSAHQFPYQDPNNSFGSASEQMQMQPSSSGHSVANINTNISGQMSMQSASSGDTSTDPSPVWGDITAGLAGSSSSYQSPQQQQSPVSNCHAFTGIESFNTNPNAGHQTTPTMLGQFFNDNLAGFFPPNQGRTHSGLGARNNPVAMTPLVPKGQYSDYPGFSYK